MPCVVVSVHDVAPPYLQAVRELLHVLDGLGARPRVLKAVPQFRGRWPLAGCPELVDLLRAEVAAGSEVVLHGYTHTTAGPLGGSWPTRLRAWVFAPRDAEFLSVDPAGAEGRLRAATEHLAELGVRPVGFCAPGWLAAPWLPDLLRRLGFRYHVTMGCLHDLQAGRRLLLPWFGSVGAGGLHESAVHVAGSPGAWLATTRYPVVKAFFHPQRPQTWAAQLVRLQRALRTRSPTTYRELLGA